jgi:hypothetical protein
MLYTIVSRACFCLENLYVSRLLEKRLSTFRIAISRLASLLYTFLLYSVVAVVAALLYNLGANSFALFC